MKNKRLITSALPYVNNIPHLGNLIQVLSGDVFARFCRQRGYETLYICGTDEYGTATETRALKEGITPKELCDRYFAIHRDIYEWFNISFDRFGRTSTKKHAEITQHLFKKLDANGYITEKTIEQLYCKKCERFLADRFISGTCPLCGYSEARGDQCESCGKLLDPTDLVEPQCGVCGGTPRIKTTRHLFINLPAILPLLEKWMESASVSGFWANNAVQMTKSWIRDGLRERCITRDLKWGIPVPKEGYSNKVFYVWFDAPIGYISITANHTDDWEAWWKDPDNVELYQFIGKDNIPFHTVIFPSTIIASKETWTKLHHLSSSEFLNYEGGKFSKSKGIGVFGNDVIETGIPSDVWRFYIYYNRPEKSDALFTWKDFQEKVNSELIGNLGNLVNRTLTFTSRYFNSEIKGFKTDMNFWNTVKSFESEITDLLEKSELRGALLKILALSAFGNKTFQEAEPWKTRKTDPESTEKLLNNLLHLLKDLSILLHPFIPEASRKLAGFLQIEDLSWDNLYLLSKNTNTVSKISRPEILFKPLEDDLMEGLRNKFAGNQENRDSKATGEKSIEERFRKEIDLRVAKIIKIEKHPGADRLFIETIDAGNGEEIQIVSGLAGHYTEEELLNRNIILAYNLKPAKFRGVKSEGMLLAAKRGDELEVLFADSSEPGTRVLLEGDSAEGCEVSGKIKIDTFFDIPISVKSSIVTIGTTPLVCSGTRIKTCKIGDGKVG